MKVAAAVACLALVGGACGDGPTSASTVPLGREFTLAPGESVFVGERALRVSFEAVTEDSRCPADALCVWAGQVVTQIGAGTRGLETLSLRPTETALVEDHRVRLVRVEPYPTSVGPIEPSRYRAVLVVER